jgi:alkylation response protein AidB-like acyl-CoA dehydrogenase
MDLEFSDEQKLLADSANRFFDNNYDLPRRRERVASEHGFSPELWAEMAELGWFALRLPEAFGGFDGSAVESALIAEAAGRALAVEPLLSTAVIGAAAIARGANQELGEALGPKVASGECRVALAQAEPKSRFALERIETSAKADGDSLVLNGHKAVVFNAPAAHKLIVSARTSGDVASKSGITLCLVDAAADGVTMRDYPTIDGMRASEVKLVNVRAQAVLGALDEGLDLLEAIVDEANVALSAETVGAVSYLLDATVEYAKTRKQFERTIGSFQVIQHRLVDMYNAVETARGMTYLAAAGLDTTDSQERTRLALCAKIKAGDAAKLVGEDAVQIHGGMGMTDELDIGHYFKRVTMIAQTFGDNEFQLRRLARLR